MQQVITEVIGMDLSDRDAHICVVPKDGGPPARRDVVEMTVDAMSDFFGQQPASRVVFEAGTHSPWLSRLLSSLGHEVVVADPRRLKLVTENVQKSDQTDAELLARVGRIDDLELIREVTHRPEQMQADYVIVKARDQLVKSRTALVAAMRGFVKSMGGRLPSCSTEYFARRVGEDIPVILRPALQPVLECIAYLTTRIKALDKLIERTLSEQYSRANELLQQVPGVGPITALSFICVIQDPERFEHSRAIGPYVGLVPRRKQSGDKDPRCGITKTGDALLRCQLTRAAHHIITFGKDSDLRRTANRLLDEGKPRQVVGCAIARKLGVLLHRLWAGQLRYEPLHQERRRLRAVAE